MATKLFISGTAIVTEDTRSGTKNRWGKGDIKVQTFSSGYNILHDGRGYTIAAGNDTEFQKEDGSPYNQSELDQLFDSDFFVNASGATEEQLEAVKEEANSYTDTRFDSVSAGVMNAIPSDSPTTGVEVYNVSAVGTYTNFGGISVTSGDLAGSLVQLRREGGAWVKVLVPIYANSAGIVPESSNVLAPEIGRIRYNPVFSTIEFWTGGSWQGVLKPMGPWQPNTSYLPFDIVTFEGAAWRVKTAFTSGANFSSVNLEEWGSMGRLNSSGQIEMNRTLRLRVDDDGGESNPKLEFYGANAKWRLGMDNANGVPGTDFVPIVRVYDDGTVQDNFYVSEQGSPKVVRFGFGVTPPPPDYRVQTAGGTTGASPEIGGYKSLVRQGQTGHAYVAVSSSGAPRWWVTKDGYISGDLTNNGGAIRILADATNGIPLTLAKSDNSAGYRFMYDGTNLKIRYTSTSVDLIQFENASGGGFRVMAARLGFFNTTPVVKQTVTGSRADGSALQNLIAALAAYGIIVDSTTA